MKKFFMTNLFLACALAFTVFYTVDSSFVTSKDQSLEIQKDNIAELERTYLNKLQLISTKSSAIDKVEEVLSVSNQETVTSENVQVEEEVIKEVQKVDHAPVINSPSKEIVKTKVAAETELELSFAEQSEQKRIVLKKIQHVAWSKLDTKLRDYGSKAYAQNSKNNKADRISTALSAQEKSSDYNLNNHPMNSNSEVKAVAGDEELVFFDYGSPTKKTVSEFQTESPKKKPSLKLAQLGALASTSASIPAPANDPIMKMIEKEFSKPSKKKGKKVSKLSRPDQLDFLVEGDSIKSLMSANQKSEPDYECLDKKDLTINQTFKTSYTLSLLEVDYKRSSAETISNFELQFHDDANLYKEDFGSGEINLTFKMNSQISVRRATILARGYYPTTIDMVFEPGSVEASVPVFTLSSFNKILSANNLRGLGAHALVELDDKTEDVEIDISKKYEAKLYLDKEFNVVSREDSAYNYILFIGVEGGNAILNFKRSDQKVVNKLAYLANDQIYYEPNFYAEVKRDTFAFYREGAFTKCKSMINIDPKQLEPWSYPGKVVKESLNSIKLSNMIYPVGSKKYVEVKYDDLQESIFVGRWGQENIVVPTEKYIGFVMEQFGRSATANSCIMQLNIIKQVKNIAFNGQSTNNNMDMQIRILDGDGEFYQDFSDRSERVFLMGQEEGTVNISINYVDGSTQYLQSFCSDATYIVEQL